MFGRTTKRLAEKNRKLRCENDSLTAEVNDSLTDMLTTHVQVTALTKRIVVLKEQVADLENETGSLRNCTKTLRMANSFLSTRVRRIIDLATRPIN